MDKLYAHLTLNDQKILKEYGIKKEKWRQYDLFLDGLHKKSIDDLSSYNKICDDYSLSLDDEIYVLKKILGKHGYYCIEFSDIHIGKVHLKRPLQFYNWYKAYFK